MEKLVVSGWIACKDQMPPRMTGVLISDGKFVTAGKWADDHWSGHEFGGWEWEWDFNDKTITHWMPLPAPPDSATGDNNE